MDLFIMELGKDPPFFFIVVFTVVLSIVLHELAHGWMAIRHGDDTPIHTGHMTGNPLVHMGPFAIIALFLFGIAWGQMPIDPTRLRGKYAGAVVAAAGPATNLILAAISLTAVGLWWRFGTFDDTQILRNGIKLLLIFGAINLLLCIFNLFPVPPLDGSHILANFHRGYANLLYDPAKQQIFFFAFIFVFMAAGTLLSPVFGWAINYTTLVAGNGGFLPYAFK
ncbi:MAG: site-2 protease family protein [Phycisphaeraceae bacterium]